MEAKKELKGKWVVSNVGQKTVYLLKDDSDNELGLVSVTKYEHAFIIIGISYINDRTKEFCNVTTQSPDNMLKEVDDAKNFLNEEWKVILG